MPSKRDSNSIFAVADEDKFLFARSQAVFKRRRALLLVVKSFLFLRLNSVEKCVTRRLSKSSPPK